MAGTYICDDYYAEECPDRAPIQCGRGHCWHESTRRRIEWQHGENRVDRADIARWNALGTRKAVAA